MKHVSISVSLPTQSVPLNRGSGLSQVLFLVVVPLSQETLQLDQFPQPDHPPSSVGKRHKVFHIIVIEYMNSVSLARQELSIEVSCGKAIL